LEVEDVDVDQREGELEELVWSNMVGAVTIGSWRLLTTNFLLLLDFPPLLLI